MRANSQLSVRRVLAGLMLAVALAVVATPVGPATAVLSSEPNVFSVNALTPTVTLDQPPLRSNDATPSFSGTASDTTSVTVEVYAGASAAGEPLATLKVQGTGGSWVSANVSPPLASGTYTAI